RQEKLLRSFLPELPKQMTLEEITEHVRYAWIGTSDNVWAGNSYNREITLESWMGELYVQLKGLKDTPAVSPVKPTHPEFLETEAGYQNAARGTVAAKDGWNAWLIETDGVWSCGGGSNEESRLAQTGKRRVLRWGWKNEQL